MVSGIISVCLLLHMAEQEVSTEAEITHEQPLTS